MKKFFSMMIIGMMTILSASYNIGDIVQDERFEDNVANRSLYSLTSEKKAIVLFWGTTS